VILVGHHIRVPGTCIKHIVLQLHIWLLEIFEHNGVLHNGVLTDIRTH